MPLSRRAYIDEHPVVFWLSLGIALTGILALIAPSLVEKGTASQALPDWLEIAFYVVWAIGGSGSTLGIAFGWTKIEAASMALLAAGLAANFVIFLWLVGFTVSAFFIVALAIGCAQRSIHLARRSGGGE